MSDWNYDPFADGSKETVRAEQLSSLQDFVKDWSSQLREVEHTLDESLSKFALKMWDTANDPVTLNVEPYEQTTLMELCAKGEIRTFNKIMMVFASLVLECQHLVKVANEKFFPAFIAYGEFDDAEEGQIQIQIGKMVEMLVNFDQFVDRCYTVVHNMMLQLAVLYSSEERQFQNTFKLVQLQTAFDALGKLLSMLVSLDEVIGCNGTFHQHWSSYKRMTRDAEVDPPAFGFRDESELFTLQNLLLQLEGRLLSSSLFRNCIQQQFDIGGFVEAVQNNSFQKVFLNSLITTQAGLLAKLSQGNSIGNQRRYMGLCSLLALYSSLFGQPVEKKMFNALWDCYQVIPIVPLQGRAFWWPSEFLTNYCPINMGHIRRPANAVSAREKAIKTCDSSFATRIKQLAHTSAIWMSRMESSLTNRLDMKNVIRQRLSLFRQGVGLASTIASELRVICALHIAMERAWHPSHVLVLCQAGELLKAIEGTFHRRSALLGESISTMIQQSQLTLSDYFTRIRSNLAQKSHQTDANLDVLASLNFALQVLSGASTTERRALLRISMHVFLRPPYARPQELSVIGQELTTLEAVCDLQSHVNASCDASILYWVRSIIPDYLQYMFHKPEHAHRIQYCFFALGDALKFLHKAVHVETPALAVAFANEIEETFRVIVLAPLARDIDQELRFHALAHYGVQKERNPFIQGVKHLVVLTKIRPIRFYNRTFDPRRFVEHELSTIFYNEVAVTQHKWRMFEEVRSLAQQKYGLHVMDSHLPGQSIDNELDVLEIMRHIHVFVKQYHYNLNNQIFIQRNSQGKNLNSISVGVISESIRTHGIGIMNTTVNFTFQFLKQRFITFSQFFFDEHIKARLYKDRKFYARERQALNNCYPYDRAMKFHVEIRKLGLHNGLSYLDRFRLLVTEIGNAIGYIRMIRSGGHHHVSAAIEFVPNLKDLPNFEELVSEIGLSQSTIDAGKNLDGVIDTLVKNFSHGSDYLRILTSVFAPDFRSEENRHLINVYMILPPLFINFVEHMVKRKMRLGKKGRAGEDALWTDDGLALGVAYILKLLDQFDKHSSLHFFDTASAHFAALIGEVQQEISVLRKRDPELEVKQAKLARLQAWRTEFNLLRFSFQGARNFFYFDETEEQQAADGDAGGEGEGEGEEAADDEWVDEEAPGGAGDIPEAPPVGAGAPPPPPPPPPAPFGDDNFSSDGFDETEDESWFGD